MSKKLTLILAAVFAIALCAPAFAAVQNIKVSGDLTLRGIYDNNYDLEGASWPTVDRRAAVKYGEDRNAIFQSAARLRVDADLTDNVTATVSIGNIRDWDVDGLESADIILDLANVTLREMLYSPLTVVIGRQNLVFGKQMIVGNGLLLDPNATVINREYSPFNGYDAVRSTFDFNPWTIDGVWVKLTETDDLADPRALGAATQFKESDRTLMGVDVGYKFDKYEGEIEGYAWYLLDRAYNNAYPMFGAAAGAAVPPIRGSEWANRIFERKETVTLGGRGSVKPMKNLYLWGEVAGQLGTVTDEQMGGFNPGIAVVRDPNTLEVSIYAMAADAGLEYAMADILPAGLAKYEPKVTLRYGYRSGQENDATGDWNEWDPMFTGMFYGAIYDFLNTIYVGAAGTAGDLYRDMGTTNKHVAKITGTCKPMQDVTFEASYMHYWMAEPWGYTPNFLAPDSVSSDMGYEVDGQLTYDYTEDVQFTLMGAWYIPGKFSKRDPRDFLTTNGRAAKDMASSVVGTCKVTF